MTVRPCEPKISLPVCENESILVSTQKSNFKSEKNDENFLPKPSFKNWQKWRGWRLYNWQTSHLPQEPFRRKF